MPKVVDHDERRRELAEAVWRVIDCEGDRGLTMRRIAEESGWSLGVITHYFPSKHALMLFAFTLMMQRDATGFREEMQRRRGLDALAAALRRNLPLSETDLAWTRVWLTSVAQALSRQDFLQMHNREIDLWRDDIRSLIEQAQSLGEADRGLDPDLETDLVGALIDGLAMHAALQPERYPPERLAALVEAYLAGRGLL
jgi:AcrR family transcriptional regulator